jgi:DNA polymerase-3 subunit gamma/tau
MSYEVLARKLRPGGFGALVGQEHVVRALTNALNSDRVHHAYLFTGTRGVGKTTIARILAKCLNCEEGVSATPCGTCSICSAIKENRFIDLIEVDAASRTGVDDTRDLLENAQYLPTIGRFKVYLIDEVHMLSNASFNALLKTLEEPPEHVKFMLATTDPKKVPVTVLSRCLQFQLKNLSRDAIAGYLAEILADEGIDAEQDALSVIAKNATGSMRDALSLTDQAIAYGDGVVNTADVVSMLGVAGRDEVGAIVAALQKGSAAELLTLSAELAERNADFVDVLKALIERLHELSVAHALGADNQLFEPDALQLYYQIALMGYRDIHIVPDERSGFEMTMLRMLSFAPGTSSVAKAGSSDSLTSTADSGSPSKIDSRGVLNATNATNTNSADYGTNTGANTNANSPAARRIPSDKTQDQAQDKRQNKDQNKNHNKNQNKSQDRTKDTASDACLATDDAPMPASKLPESEILDAQTPVSVAAAATTDGCDNDGVDAASTDAASTDAASTDAARAIAARADAVSGPSTPDSTGNLDQEPWYTIVEALTIGGVSRMIAEHAIIVEFELPKISLRLDEKHDMLLNEAQRQTLERAITEQMGKAVTLSVEIGRTAQETPSQRKSRLSDERQQAAEAAIADDATVNNLLADFGGQLDEVRPR